MPGANPTDLATATLPPKARSAHLLWWVNLALLPGIAVMVFTLGTAYLWQLAIAGALAVSIESACLLARGQSVRLALDGSAVVTALLIGISLPPGVSLWVLSLAVLGGVGLAKQLFGGLGHNLFNPAMVGYALVLVSFPAELAVWPADAITGATPLDIISHRQSQTFTEAVSSEQFGNWGGLPWQWINLAFLAGGCVLLVLRLARWRVVAGVLLALGAAAALTYDAGSSLSNGSPLYHWFTGATMLTAFFVATDPVTHPQSTRGQWLFGALVGLLIFVIRAYGSYPDGAAFAVLLANAAAPSLDHWTLTKTKDEPEAEDKHEDVA